MLIDTHLHLIDRRRLSYPWLGGVPALNRDWPLTDYAAAAGRCGITAALHVEVDVAPDAAEAETAMVAEARSGGLVIGAIAAARPERPDIADWLAGLDRGLVRGLRRVLHVVPDPVSAAPGFRAGLRAIGRAGLPFDLCLRADQLALGAALADACADTQFVLDHCGNPEIARQGYDAWAGPLADLARRPNVAVKLSGLLAQTGAEWGVATLQPYVEHVIESFGWDRMVWGSDWPVVTLGGSLSDWVAATHALTRGCSTAERAALFHGNARRLWSLP